MDGSKERKEDKGGGGVEGGRALKGRAAADERSRGGGQTHAEKTMGNRERRGL